MPSGLRRMLVKARMPPIEQTHNGHLLWAGALDLTGILHRNPGSQN